MKTTQTSTTRAQTTKVTHMTDQESTHEPEYSIDDVEIPDECLVEIAEIAPDLTNQERKYVYWRSVANPPIVAHRKAGYAGTSWRQVETRPKIREALHALNERLEPEYRVTLQKVIGMVMEGFDMAKLKGQPKVMVEAATALANMTGLAAAQKVQIDQRTHVEIENRSQQMKALQQIPRVSLEEMAGVHRELPYIEADFVEVRRDAEED